MINKLHVHEWVPIRKGFPQKICKCGELKVGTHTVLLGDKIRFTSTKVASILGDIGMSLATGHPQTKKNGYFPISYKGWKDVYVEGDDVQTKANIMAQFGGEFV